MAFNNDSRPSTWALWLWLQAACAPASIVHGSGTEHALETLQAMLREQELPGAQYVAVTAQRTLIEIHVGQADVRSAQAMERDTLQMAYSISKAITAIVVLQLVDKGKLGLERPLSDFYTAHPYGPQVTIGRLLTHTAGVPNPMPLDWFALDGEALERDARLRQVLDDNPELEAEPGTEYGYTNLGYWLLEKAIEAASGEDYARYVQQQVFARVGLAASAAGFDLPAQQIAAVGHSRRMSPMNAVLWAMTPSRYWASPHGGWSRAERLLPHGRGYGGLFCSAEALAHVLQDLLQDNPRLLSAQARDRMFSDQRTNDGASTSATLGWVTGKLDGVPFVGKQGGGFGFHGNVRIYRTLGLATVLLANRTEITPSPIDARSDAIDLGFVRELAAARRNAGGAAHTP